MAVPDKIIQIDKNINNPLRKITREIEKSEFGTKNLKDVIRAMKTALNREDDGVAIAAPQIGQNLRIFVISEKSFDEEAKYKPLVFINPKLIKVSKKKNIVQEGCLSVRWIYGKTERSIRATVEAYDEDGNKFTFGAGGLLAHIFQHEIDHLDGILFIDHGFDFEEFSEEEIRKAYKQIK